MMGIAAFAVAEGMGELEQPRHPRRQQLLHGEFGRSVQKRPALLSAPRLAAILKNRRERLEMRLEAGAHLEGRCFDLGEAPGLEELTDGARHGAAHL